jgi:hypothetical protein
MTDELAKFRTSTGKIRRLLNDTALQDGNEPFHTDIYLSVHEDRIETIVAKANNSVLTNCTFRSSYFDDLELLDDEAVGAILNVTRTLDYLGISDTEGTVEVSLLGSEDQELAQSIEVDGGLSAKWKLPTAQEVLERVPQELPERYDEDNRFQSSDGKYHTTQIETAISTFSRIHEAVELDSEVDFYPITVEDESLRLELGRDGGGKTDRTAVWGDLPAESVSSDEESLQNWYNTGFEPVTKTLNGGAMVEVSGGAPMSIVQDGDTEKTIRHVLAPVEEPE